MYIYFWKKIKSRQRGLTKGLERGIMGKRKLQFIEQKSDKLLMNNEVAASG